MVLGVFRVEVVFSHLVVVVQQQLAEVVVLVFRDRAERDAHGASSVSSLITGTSTSAVA